jgi:methylmalonyl-CoA mutase
MSEPVRALADGFPPADLPAWRARASESLGIGAAADGDFERALVRRTLDGIARGPLMTRADAPAPQPASPWRTAGPGAAYPWDIRALIRHPDPARANKDALEELEGGACSLELKIDPAGEDGVMIRSLDDLARALDGVHLDLAPLSLDAGDFAAPAAAMLLALRRARGLAPEAGGGALNLDPLGRLARRGALDRAIDAEIADAAAWAAHVAEAWPNATVFRADGRVVHEAGGSEAWEIAYAAAAGIACLEAMVARGLAVEDAARPIAFALALDADVHFGVAKLRALRRVWRRIATAAGASETAAHAPIQAFSSARMLARRDPWTNLVRLTAAGFAGAVGGADALTLAPFTDALGPPRAFARRLSRNIQLLLAAEAGVGRVEDAARGSFHHEALTDALARRAWTNLQEIAAAGGIAAFIAGGRLRQAVDDARTARAEALARGDAALVGVTDYVPDTPVPADTDPIDLAALRAAADERSAARPRTAPTPDPQSPQALIALAESGADFAAFDAAAAQDSKRGLSPIRLAAPFERPAP